jgi:hypothetical protein
MGLLPLKALNGILTCCEEKQSSLDRSVEFVRVDVGGATGYLKGSSGVWYGFDNEKVLGKVGETLEIQSCFIADEARFVMRM